MNPLEKLELLNPNCGDRTEMDLFEWFSLCELRKDLLVAKYECVNGAEVGDRAEATKWNCAKVVTSSQKSWLRNHYFLVFPLQCDRLSKTSCKM